MKSCKLERKVKIMDSTNTGKLIPPTNIQRGISSPVQTADPGPDSTAVNMLHDAKDVLYPYKSQNMQFYQMLAMVNYSTGDSFQYTPGIGQYLVLQSYAHSENKSVVITNTTNTTTNITTTITAGAQGTQTVH